VASDLNRKRPRRTAAAPLARGERVAAYVRAVRLALDSVPDATHASFVQAVLAAGQIVVAGRGRSGMMGRAFARRLGQMGLRVWGLDDTTVPRLGAGDLLVAEADESDGSFLRLTPVIAVVTNIDPEHLDHYGSYEALQEAFAAFANRIPFWGLSVLCFDHPGVQAIVPQMTRRKVTYGFAPQADIVASAVEVDGTGMRFSVHERGAALGDVRIRLPGRHNVLNALATIAVTRELAVPFADTAAAIESFLGIERRFEPKGEVAGIRVFDDYGHHPAEIRATLASARAFHRGRVVVAFQPHRYTRTRDLWDDFITAFNDADLLVMTEIYAAGEDKIPGIESAPLVEAICDHGHRSAHFVGDLEAVVERLLPELKAGDLVLTLGAGNISALGEQLIRRLRGETP